MLRISLPIWIKPSNPVGKALAGIEEDGEWGLEFQFHALRRPSTICPGMDI